MDGGGVVDGGDICGNCGADEGDPDAAGYTQLPVLGFVVVIVAAPWKSQLVGVGFF